MNNSNYDQVLAEVRDKVPALWWALYSGCLEQGFNPLQAIELVKTYICVNQVSQKNGNDSPTA